MSPILKLKKPNEKKEIDFELDYLSSIPYKARLEMMLKASKHGLTVLIKNGYRKPSEIIKRK
ncbi:hypothetical protein A2625_01075 [candidate division WOR-1 bacterium RIFCSPHIGHO2_01_FULL_53_15]|uniref:Uncharacterized protein n=1 Tax=candidate division WOR-1 bacterium RIFCSPHIGHO2_01_FULL_53_15 TaxID=1802564 RepID=A0A1F4Q0D9_UNCSA|nr:MAG: hypothetical protein A2625_01075 [candidate division WOR-1 bacterium RIFCSPHIGHO2_01_FULL_53_15]OGC10740.1 MAG: hypothetical protein A3D23_04585 [candidate division WOR-1 bacterium RIFCSPHIGHO2_02_FULL_53_26]